MKTRTSTALSLLMLFLLLIAGGCPAGESASKPANEAPVPPVDPLETMLERMSAGEWNAYSEIAANSGNPYTSPSGTNTFRWPPEYSTQYDVNRPRFEIYFAATGLPVQVVADLQVAPEYLGATAEEIADEFAALATAQPAANNDAPRLAQAGLGYDYLIFDQRPHVLAEDPFTAFRYGDVHAELIEVQAEGQPELALLFLELDPAAVRKLQLKRAKHPQYLEPGTANLPATLAELIQLYNRKGAGGILGQYDFSTFEQAVSSSPPDYAARDLEYWESVYYRAGTRDSLDVFQAELGITNDDESSSFEFSDAWWAAANGLSTVDLNSEFDTLLAKNDGATWSSDNPDDTLDLHYSCFIDGDVIVYRKLYPRYNSSGPLAYFKLGKGPLDKAIRPEHVAEADWHNPDLHLPATGEHIGEFEELLRMTVSATAPELAGKLGLIKHEESEFNLSALNNPYTTLTGFDWPDPKTEPGAAGDNASCFMGAIDGFYTASIRFNVAWFEQEYGIAPDELNRQFESLYEQYSNQTDDYLTSREDFSTSIFRYGSVVVTRITRREPADMAGLDYTIKPPSWNLLLEELQHGDLY